MASDSTSADIRTTLMICLILGLATAITIAVTDWVTTDKSRYSKEYSVPEDKVSVQPKPHDCDWGKAPLGSKYCHFEKAVNPIKDENGKVVEVYVGWTKVGE
jgi:hypothetical protein